MGERIFVPQKFSTEEVSSLIPHKGKMFLLSRITEHNLEERTATGEYDITSDCIFYEESLDGIPDWSVFESWRRPYRHSVPLGGLRRAKWTRPIPV